MSDRLKCADCLAPISLRGPPTVRCIICSSLAHASCVSALIDTSGTYRCCAPLPVPTQLDQTITPRRPSSSRLPSSRVACSLTGQLLVQAQSGKRSRSSPSPTASTAVKIACTNGAAAFARSNLLLRSPLSSPSGRLFSEQQATGSCQNLVDISPPGSIIDSNFSPTRANMNSTNHITNPNQPTDSTQSIVSTQQGNAETSDVPEQQPLWFRPISVALENIVTRQDLQQVESNVREHVDRVFREHAREVSVQIQNLEHRMATLEDALRGITEVRKLVSSTANSQIDHSDDSLEIRVNNIPSICALDPPTIAVRVLRAIGCEMLSSQIIHARPWLAPRPANSGLGDRSAEASTRSIVFQVASHICRDKIMQCAPRLRNVTVSSVLGVESSARLYIHAILPKALYQLHNAAREKARELKLPAPQLRGIRIFMRLKSGSPPIQISSKDDLLLFCSRLPPTLQISGLSSGTHGPIANGSSSATFTLPSSQPSQLSQPCSTQSTSLSQCKLTTSQSTSPSFLSQNTPMTSSLPGSALPPPLQPPLSSDIQSHQQSSTISLSYPPPHPQ